MKKHIVKAIEAFKRKHSLENLETMILVNLNKNVSEEDVAGVNEFLVENYQEVFAEKNSSKQIILHIHRSCDIRYYNEGIENMLLQKEM